MFITNAGNFIYPVGKNRQVFLIKEMKMCLREGRNPIGKKIIIAPE